MLKALRFSQVVKNWPKGFQYPRSVFLFKVQIFYDADQRVKMFSHSHKILSLIFPFLERLQSGGWIVDDFGVFLSVSSDEGVWSKYWNG